MASTHTADDLMPAGEEVKAADLEMAYGQSYGNGNGNGAEGSSSGGGAAHILPLEIEDSEKASGGLVGDKAEGGKVLEEGGVAKKGVCARHWGKFLCAGITLAILATIAIATPLLWYTEPTAELLSQSNLRIDGLGSVAVDLQLRVKNTNRYPVAFQNLNLDIYNMNGNHIGQVTRNERKRVAARGTAVMAAKATIRASIIELFAMGLDCLANDNMTKLKIRGTADGRLFGKKVVQVVGPFEQMTQCVTMNINGGPGNTAGGAGAGAGGAADGQQPGFGNGQIIQQIGQAIGDLFGGGPRPAAGAGGAAGPGPGPGPAAGAGLPGAGPAPAPGQ